MGDFPLKLDRPVSCHAHTHTHTYTHTHICSPERRKGGDCGFHMCIGINIPISLHWEIETMPFAYLLQILLFALSLVDSDLYGPIAERGGGIVNFY